MRLLRIIGFSAVLLVPLLVARETHISMFWVGVVASIAFDAAAWIRYRQLPELR